MKSHPPTSEDGLIVIEGEVATARFEDLASGTVACTSVRSPAKDTANQDGYALLPATSDSSVIAVADGAGGMPGGDRASRLALEALRDAMHEGRAASRSTRESILTGIDSANDAVSGLELGAATTLAVVEISADRFRTYHVGDSQVLAYTSSGMLKVLTIPHSPVGYALESGMIDEAEAMTHPERHLLTNCIGLPTMHVEMSARLPLDPGDTIVVASDGLWDNLTLQEIVEGLADGPFEAAFERLAEACRARMTSPQPGLPSKPDDLTIVVYRR